jgi:hypothetical protein
MDLNRLMGKKDRITVKRGKRSILDLEDQTHIRKNASLRNTFDLVDINCVRCTHKKGFDKTTQKNRSGVFCCKCGLKQNE